MFVALSFIGRLPSYVIECTRQIKFFFDGEIYLIIDDVNSEFISKLSDVNIVNYESVKSYSFDEKVSKHRRKFCIIDGLHDRKELFIRSLERFFLLHNLMEKNKLEDCLFLELDNLIYDNPNNWLPEFSKYELTYMFDNFDRCSSGLMYVKSSNSLVNFMNYILNYIESSKEFLNEMTCLYRYYEQNKNTVQILPTYFKDESLTEIVYQHYPKYNNSIFDALGIGIFLLGLDTFHTGGNVQTGLKNMWGYIDYTKCKFEWKTDEKNRRIAYIWDGTNWIRINNLHVHSKQLKNGLSFN